MTNTQRRQTINQVRTIGATVQSEFRARWYGVVVALVDSGDHCVQVRITHDRRGNPIRKPNSARNVHTLSAGWLVPAAAPVRR